MFNIKEIRKLDFLRGELIWEVDEKFVIGKGIFLIVYSGVLFYRG